MLIKLFAKKAVAKVQLFFELTILFYKKKYYLCTLFFLDNKNMIKHQNDNVKFSPRTDLILPEYGRNVQQMVEHAVTIEDKTERTKCANSIINIMGNMFPYLRDIDGFKYKLWDHLAIMSRFKLDIDYPFEIIKQENLNSKPTKLDYNTKRFHYLHYGAIIENFIEKACQTENQEEKNALIMSIANYMKKSLLAWNNKDIDIDDIKIFNDLRELSGGRISISSDDFQLISSENLRPPKRNNNNNQNQNNNNKRKRRR